MQLYLVQHGESAAKEVDPQRALTDSGRRDVERIASQLSAAGVRPARILHSGKLRAVQTAAIIASAVGLNATEPVSGIDPTDPVEPFADRVRGFTADTMVVGHLPFMARLVAYLLTGTAAEALVDFRTGSVVCLTRKDERGWALQWMLRPDLAG